MTLTPKELEIKERQLHAGLTGHRIVGEMLDAVGEDCYISTNRPDCGWIVEDMVTGKCLRIFEDGTWELEGYATPDTEYLTSTISTLREENRKLEKALRRLTFDMEAVAQELTRYHPLRSVQTNMQRQIKNASDALSPGAKQL